MLVQPLGIGDAPRGTACWPWTASALACTKGIDHPRRTCGGQALGRKAAPVDAAIIGIIDQVDVDGDL